MCRVPLALPSPLLPPCITPCEHQGALPARGFYTGPTLVRALQNPARERGGQRTRRKGRLFNKERRISPNMEDLICCFQPGVCGRVGDPGSVKGVEKNTRWTQT